MPFYLITNKPVSRLEDVKGLKIRGLGGLLDILAGEMGTSVVRFARVSPISSQKGNERAPIRCVSANPEKGVGCRMCGLVGAFRSQGQFEVLFGKLNHAAVCPIWIQRGMIALIAPNQQLEG